MNNSGVSIEFACADKTVGTEEDFERLCNKDGTVKDQPKTTTFTLKSDGTRSITVNNTHLQIAIAGVVVLTIVIVGIVVRKMLKRRTR